jgi:hypothetical protein
MYSHQFANHNHDKQASLHLHYDLLLATAFHRVWAVQYLNSMGAVILDTVEIGDVPTAACAAKEDFEDSAIRLRHILQGELQ